MRPSPGTWLVTQARAHTRNQTSDPFGLQAGVQSTKPHQPGLEKKLFMNLVNFKRNMNFSKIETHKDTKTEEPKNRKNEITYKKYVWLWHLLYIYICLENVQPLLNENSLHNISITWQPRRVDWNAMVTSLY